MYRNFKTYFNTRHMAVERAKVLSVIEAKLKGKSLSKNFKENLASKWAEKFDTDEDIDAYIEDREDILSEASSEADRRATEAAAKAKGEKKDPEPPKDPASPPPTEEAPAWLKPILENQKLMADKLNALESEKQQTTIQSKVKSLIGNDIPESWLKGKTLPSDPEQVETWVTEEKAAYTAFMQENFNSSVGNARPAFGAAGAGKKEASKEETDALAAKLIPKN